MNKAVFFDRDGTLNEEVHYLHKIEDFKWIEGAIDAIKYCNDNGFLAIVITNQSGVARGYYPESDIMKLYDWMNTDLAKHGAHLDGIYYCPHHPTGKVKEYAIECDCRKPKPGMLFNAKKDHNIDLKSSYLIGDSARDVECAEAAGVKGIMYKGGNLYQYIVKEMK
ncbi:MAG: D-glycero-beta-D-manno-heptose 1,7-bisphosphate 7-phosphatase [Anaerovibrio sp.]|uniref:D-glycero-beta-D-manno-heptose 1,7-bisphosphate 7-phosphatase n=1 Tax=Anaerovibrio sp. TaxID=1872532 RepID=UPI001B1D2579|nr:D-glycero-beta-D-manno-heptose 1,7-bisphosphate 7-phosphatase [Anaerovibrio sp.]MBO5588353.1 D-glycero-beta-D-manno-heptose 1,7-bisphosphate 7-phosphatase [Anaerovibrio sp.]MBO6244714.1 D-glycero-beta-D-manno-heptose 1,7-bisphosphate 7-phosphatase [Anaerovibrio sp.]